MLHKLHTRSIPGGRAVDFRLSQKDFGARRDGSPQVQILPSHPTISNPAVDKLVTL